MDHRSWRAYAIAVFTFVAILFSFSNAFAQEAAAAPPGWKSADAYQKAMAAVAADSVGKYDECIDDDKGSLAIEEQPGTRLHLAACESRGGKLLDGLRDAQKALEDGIQHQNVPVMQAARMRIQRILPLIPHVSFVPPKGVTDINITFDDRPVPADSFGKRFSVDPGKHTVHAEGMQGGIPLSFDHEYTVRESEMLQVDIVLKSQASEYLTPGQLKCMLGAKNQEDVIKCLPQNKKPLVVKAGMGVSGYTDSDHVNVVSPEVNGSVSSPTQGWNVAGSFLVDVVSAASPDIVSEASPPYHEKRYAGVLSGGYKPGKYGVQGNAFWSEEPDYRSQGAGLAVTADLKDKLITPRLGYNYRHDIIGRNSTPFDVIGKPLDVSSLDAGVTFILSPTSIILVGATAEFERGDQSKPYRYIPLFDPAVAPFVPAGATVTLVNLNRLPLRPVEQLPTERDRYALGMRFAHRFSSATLRLEERLYYDSWQQKSTTTDARYVFDLSRTFEVWPHFRFNAQNAANFYQLAYSAALDPKTGQIIVPTYRSDDRELSPLVTLTGGGGTRIALTGAAAKTQLGLTIQADVMYTKFFNALFISQRTAVYGAVGLDAEFQ